MSNKLSARKCKKSLPKPYTGQWATVNHYKNTALCLLKKNNCVNTFAFNDAGIKAPSTAIRKLKNVGFSIDVSLTDIRSSDGILHKNVATYCLCNPNYQPHTNTSQLNLFLN